ncbi:protein high chlorophyll fluorescent 107 [Telopea speciosissima]|uniref:protein high chlorophyll fluorescent 107 n=1 Tax=Telopea speciosissima TaxID=54955 RepID=UPI001CC692C0|nr:protein high chlorophyll fluorescent 107 [Telopea speciosissima]
MQVFSSCPKSQFLLFSPSLSSDSSSKFNCRIAIKYIRSSSRESFPALEEKRLNAESPDDKEINKESERRRTRSVKESPEGFLVVRKPTVESSGEETDAYSTVEGAEADEQERSSSSLIDVGLSELAKKLPMFEPKSVELSPEVKPLGVNLELALYRAKVLARKYQFEEAERILRQCIKFWPEDGRPYVALGKVLTKQSKYAEARTIYERGCQATQGENPYIWQCRAVMENKMGNRRRARELFDAATVADKRHVAAWHGWAVLELKEGNIKKARHLLGKGLKYCGGNEYIYQTLALLEAKANRIEQARYLFRRATTCSPKSCASWLAWAQLEMQQENDLAARKLFQEAVQASPKNRFAWHVWGVFEANLGNIDKGRKLLQIGHALNPRDPVLLQSLALLEYKHSSANLARVLFRRASELDPAHQPVWIAWGWMEWKEGNLGTARDLYQRALSINSTSESAARCLHAWGVLEQRIGNLAAARRLFRSSLNINSQSYVTWMTCASLEEEQGNFVRAEEIRNLYFQQRIEVVDDASWVMGFLDIIDPALDSIKKLLNLENSDFKGKDSLKNITGTNRDSANEGSSDPSSNRNTEETGEEEPGLTSSSFDLDTFISEKLLLDASKLAVQMESSAISASKNVRYSRRALRLENRTS